VEDVAGSDQATKEIFKADFFAFWEVSGGHGRFVGLRYAFRAAVEASMFGVCCCCSMTCIAGRGEERLAEMGRIWNHLARARDNCQLSRYFFCTNMSMNSLYLWRSLFEIL
jgi:hypothetical protein